MRPYFLLPVLLAVSGCNFNSGNNSATSTPIDSTKTTGAAPVQYGPDNPADDSVGTTGANEPVIQSNDGLEYRRTQNGMGVDTMGGTKTPPDARGVQQSPSTATNPKPKSNTTDPRTTGGSAPR